MDGAAQFHLELTPSGRGSKVEINGQDVASNVRGVAVQADASGQLTQVSLNWMAESPVTIEGEGIVRIFSESNNLREWLDNIDADQLSEAALKHLDVNPGTPMQAALDVLRAWAKGESP